MLCDKHACWALLLWSVRDVFLRTGWGDSAGRRQLPWASSTGASSVDVRTVGGVWPSHGPEPGSCVTVQPQPGNNVSAVLSTWTPELPRGLQAPKVSWPHQYPDPPCTSMALAAPCLLLACTPEGHGWSAQSLWASSGLAKPANSSARPRAEPHLLYWNLNPW